MDADPRHPPHELGRWGEERAARFLIERGWRILARNYRFGRREVDLVVARDGVVAFVEVKTRAGTGFGRPEEAVSLLKRREIEAVATHFLSWRGRLVGRGPTDTTVRFDVVSVLLDRMSRTVRIDHLEDAWRPGWT
ncbi:MAG TPA: YraN family protein [Longimicrobiales bacterium]|nr:YraN family protein [Longimicrobiales bacterium]